MQTNIYHKMYILWECGWVWFFCIDAEVRTLVNFCFIILEVLTLIRGIITRANLFCLIINIKKWQHTHIPSWSSSVVLYINFGMLAITRVYVFTNGGFFVGILLTFIHSKLLLTMKTFASLFCHFWSFQNLILQWYTVQRSEKQKLSAWF